MPPGPRPGLGAGRQGSGRAWQGPELVLHGRWEDTHPHVTWGLLGFQETLGRKPEGCNSHKAAGNRPEKHTLNWPGDPVFTPSWWGWEGS